jgi:uncharacterized BrkB/YihY/UPF0761 family membrane protein
MKNLLCFLGFLAFTIIGVLTALGEVQDYTNFNGVANEIAFCLISFLIAGMFMLSAILPDERKKNKRQHGFE